MRCILILLFSIIPLSFACHSKTINWLVVDFVPYYIVSGKNAGAGRDEGVIKLLEKSMEQYAFNTTFVPASRAIHELSNPLKNYCMLSLYKNKQRKQYIRFSGEFSTVGLSPSVAMHSELAKQLKLDETQLISLQSLLSKHKLTLGVPTNRSYGMALDNVINSKHNATIINRAGRDTLMSLTYMLYKRRVDIVLGYPSEHFYLAHGMGLKNKLIQLPLLESPDLSFGYIGCNKNAKGAENISALNVALQKIKKAPEYQSTMLKWLPKNLQPLLQAQLSAPHQKATR